MELTCLQQFFRHPDPAAALDKGRTEAFCDHCHMKTSTQCCKWVYLRNSTEHPPKHTQTL